MAKVKFIPQNIVVSCETGENLLEVARKANIFIDAPCNGSIACGKCKVKLLKGNANSEKTLHIKDDEWENGYILACNTKIIEDIEIEIPSQLSTSMHEMKIEGLSSEKDKAIFKRAKNFIIENNMEFKSYVRKDYVQIDDPTLDDNISDYDRIKRHLRNSLGYEQVNCRLQLLRKLPKILREGEFKVTLTHIPRGNKTTIVNVEIGNTTNRLYGVAVDIGTTSVVVCLVDLNNGEIIAKSSSGNAQIKYGADVINRIIYSTKKDGLDILNKSIIDETINPLLDNIYSETKVTKDEIMAFVASGNTTMTHLFLGIYPDYLRREPYIPAFLKSPIVKASELGLNVNPDTFIYLSPSVASYVGGDITAGVLASGIWTSDENVLFIDLGTNGEIVFGNKDYLMTCACSAGPAFEGGEISCGMRASTGAIEEITIEENLKPILKVIGDVAPIGICGSGIIDLIAEMMLKGIIDRRGKINKNLNNSRIRFDEHDIGEYVLAFRDEYDIEGDITITEVDIDNFIRAKGAVYSGASTLIKSLGLDFSIIDKLYIAGGIGNSLDIERSILIGLLPDIDREKFMYIGNSSLVGSYLTLMSEDARTKLEEIGNQMTYVELSVYPTYMDEFISACFLPHTNIEEFPTVKDILEV